MCLKLTLLSGLCVLQSELTVLSGLCVLQSELTVLPGSCVLQEELPQCYNLLCVYYNVSYRLSLGCDARCTNAVVRCVCVLVTM